MKKKITKVSTIVIENGPENIIEKEYFDHDFMTKREVIIEDIEEDDNSRIHRNEKFYRIGPFVFVVKNFFETDDREFEVFFYGNRKINSIDDYIFHFGKDKYAVQWFKNNKLVKQTIHMNDYIDKLFIKYDKDMYPVSFKNETLRNGEIVEILNGKFKAIYPGKIEFYGTKANDVTTGIAGVYDLKNKCSLENKEFANDALKSVTKAYLNDRGDIEKIAYTVYDAFLFKRTTNTIIDWEYFD